MKELMNVENPTSIYVISAVTENALRVLQRLAGIFARQRINIEQMNIFEVDKTGVSHFTIIVKSEESKVSKLVKQLEKIIELLEVKINSRIH